MIVRLESAKTGPLPGKSVSKDNLHLPCCVMKYRARGATAGAHDALVTRSVADALAGSELVASVGAVDSGEAADEYARLVADVVRRAIASMPAAGRVDGGAAMVNEVLARVQEVSGSFDASADLVEVPEPRSLSSLVRRVATGDPEPATHPKTRWRRRL